MSHPYELLADFVDGTLDEDDLAGVQAHLEACGSCRGEVADAAAGAEAARSLPLEEPPPDLHRRVVEGGRGRGAPPWYRWAGAGAAAVVVLAIAVALPNVGGGARDTDPAGEDRQEASFQDGGASPDELEVTRQDRNYDAAGLQELARSATRAAGEVATSSAEASAPNSEAAVRCVSDAFGNQELGRLTRIIQARFEGEEAYIAVYLEGPGAGGEPDLVNVLAASRDDCTFLSLAYDTP
jgi:hypothetical protein